VVRTAVQQAMRILAGQFVVGETIEEGPAASAAAGRVFRFSYDMLGEAARTAEDAARYFELYSHAIRTVTAPDGVSMKLSACTRASRKPSARGFSQS
jgi:RHH-type proline utilization regulon transcriptional repressor/proline dehydrogenase/delta 1-pyrroline-5-carboxylate dehydrogenase